MKTFLFVALLFDAFNEIHLCPPQCSCFAIDKSVACRPKGHLEFPKNIPKDTMTLGLYDFTIKDIHGNHFTGFYNMRRLYLENCSISNIHPESFKVMTYLVDLSLSGNKIKYIRAGTFSYLRNLKHLGLASNLLTIVESEMFWGLGQLSSLQISDNPIERIMPRSFTHLLNLKSLQIHRNRLSFLNADSLTGLPLLKELDLHENIITSINLASLNESQMLKHLVLFGNRLSKIDNSTLGAFPQLTDLDLNNNLLTSLGDEPFAKMEKLERLMLYDNKLTQLHSKMFTGLNKLQELDVRNNTINSIEDGTFFSLNSLHGLYLEENKLISIFPCTFVGLSSVERLDLSGNRLFHIAENSFYWMRNLRTLVLSRNRLTKISESGIERMAKLEHLDVSNNQLDSLPMDFFHGFEELKSLNLFGNEIICTCEYLKIFGKIKLQSAMTDCWLPKAHSCQRTSVFPVSQSLQSCIGDAFITTTMQVSPCEKCKDTSNPSCVLKSHSDDHFSCCRRLYLTPTTTSMTSRDVSTCDGDGGCGIEICLLPITCIDELDKRISTSFKKGNNSDQRLRSFLSIMNRRNVPSCSHLHKSIGETTKHVVLIIILVLFLVTLLVTWKLCCYRRNRLVDVQRANGNNENELASHGQNSKAEGNVQTFSVWKESAAGVEESKANESCDSKDCQK